MSSTITMKFTINMDNSTEEITISRTKTIPNFADFQKQGFRDSFHDLEGEMIALTKEIETEATEIVLSTLSQQMVNEAKARLNTPDLEVVESTYGIESKFGTIHPISHRLILGKETQCNTADEFYPKKSPCEKWYSSRLNELMLWSSDKISYRHTAELLNKVRDQEYGIKTTTIRNHTEKEGFEMAAMKKDLAAKALIAAGFDGDMNIDPKIVKQYDEDNFLIDKALLAEEGKRLNAKNFNILDFTMPGEAVNISLDDVGVKRQSPVRPKKEGKKDKTYVENTISHVQTKDGEYILNGLGTESTLKLTMGFLAHNNALFTRPIVFFTDGARSIHKAIETLFKDFKYSVILDWFHLSKKCREQFSSIFKGKEISKDFLNTVKPLLWEGDLDGAIEVIKKADPKKVKDTVTQLKFIEYLERMRYCIPNYSLRAALKLRNSSNRGEKSNDLVVATRQKHQGMGWSEDGSVGLSSVSTVCRNNELWKWCTKRVIDFNFVLPLSRICLDKAA